jgi:hypothetical protein
MSTALLRTFLIALKKVIMFENTFSLMKIENLRLSDVDIFEPLADMLFLCVFFDA